MSCHMPHDMSCHINCHVISCPFTCHVMSHVDMPGGTTCDVTSGMSYVDMPGVTTCDVTSGMSCHVSYMSCDKLINKVIQPYQKQIIFPFIYLF